MFTYDGIKAAERRVRGQDHCGSNGPVFELGSLIIEGAIRDPADLSSALTAGVSVTRKKQSLIYAVDENFTIHVGFDGVRGQPDAVKHETLFHNADVRAAGELEIENGVIVEVGDISGTYGTPGRIQTDPSFVDAVLRSLDRIAAPIERGERRRLERRVGKR
jgi:hypothetical protein